MDFTNNEVDVLKTLLVADHPLTSAEIIANSVNKTWKDRSIHLFIKMLLEKGAIQEVGFVRTGKTFGRTFAVTDIGRREHLNMAVDFIKDAAPTEIVAAMFDREDVNIETLQNIEKMIKKRKRELK